MSSSPTVLTCQVAGRSSEKSCLQFTSGRLAPTDQRCAGWAASERWARFRSAAGIDESQWGSWPTYTVGYGSSFADDELADAESTAGILDPIIRVSRLSRPMFEEALPKIVASLEEPIATSSIVPMYFICERARQEVKVALVGQGPDELFGGYRRHLGVRYGAFWSRMPKLRCVA